MDLTKLIDKYGTDKIEKYLSIYYKAKFSAGGTALCVLRLINEKLFHFTEDNTSSTFDDIDLKEFLECAYWFTLMPKYFN
uniref:P9 n=1 Tax=croton golden spot associated virus C TaxID=3072822 RepID=A0AA50E466_9CLOS|nr:p9 [croton golden spot associated virus C]